MVVDFQTKNNGRIHIDMNISELRVINELIRADLNKIIGTFSNDRIGDIKMLKLNVDELKKIFK